MLYTSDPVRSPQPHVLFRHRQTDRHSRMLQRKQHGVIKQWTKTSQGFSVSQLQWAEAQLAESYGTAGTQSEQALIGMDSLLALGLLQNNMHN